MGDKDSKIGDFDTILCTNAVKEKLLLSAVDTGINLSGIKILTAHESIFKNIKTKEGRPCDMVLINAKKLWPPYMPRHST